MTRVGAWFSYVILLLAVAFHVCAQVPSSLTPEQLQLFQTLSPEQQRAILDALSKSSSGGAASSQSPASSGQVQQPSSTVGQQPGTSTGIQGLAPTQMGTGNQGMAPPNQLPENSTNLLMQQGGSSFGPPRIVAGSTVIIAADVKLPEDQKDVTAPPPDQNGEQNGDEDTKDPAALEKLLKDRRDRILARNPYTIDDSGRVLLPGLPAVTLGGLTADEAGELLNAEPYLAGLTLTVTLLPVSPSGAEALLPFGYDVFTSGQSNFAPPTDVPAPTDYILGPGDTLVVELSGKRFGSYPLTVDRNGQLHLLDFGPIGVAGLSFDKVKATIERLVATQMIGVRASVTMGELRTIRIFVTGDVNHPSSYLVSALSTVTNAIFVSGGVSKIGSLRNIEVKRKGALVRKLDLYSLLLKGDSSGDVRLEEGDVVFVPPVGETAGASGEVNRPAIYEIHPGSKVADLIELSGGLTPEADGLAAKLNRIDHDGQRDIIDLDLSRSSARNTPLETGDVLTVPRVLDELARGVTLKGDVLRPGDYSWHPGMRLTQLFGSLNSLKDDADQRYIVIRRERFPDRRFSVLSVDGVRAFEEPGSVADPLLQSHDTVMVFPLQADRGGALRDLVKQLRSQARDDAAPPIVSVNGRVIAPGVYPLEIGMRVGDLIRAGGGLKDGAYTLDAELARFVVEDGQYRRTELIPIQLPAVLGGNEAADITLRPYDTLTVKQVPDWANQGVVTLQGEVRFPGPYPIRKGETLSSVLKRAGGLTEFAFPQGAVFTRDEIKQQEQEQIDKLAQRMQSDLTTMALQSSQIPQANASNNTAEALRVGQNLLTQLRQSQPVGRLVINLSQAMSSPGSDDDVQLRGGDTLIVPRVRQYVTVIGEVQNPTAHIWRHELDRSDYIQMSGGTTQHADRKRIYVVRADGAVAANETARWFRGSNIDIRRGDTIVVPLDAQKLPALPMWQAITQIIYNIAIGVAAIHGL